MDKFTILPGQNVGDAKGSVTTEPAVATPPVTVPNVDDTIARIKAKLEGKAVPPAGTQNAKPPTETPKPDDKKQEDELDPKTVPPKVLAELGRLQGKVREYEPKIKELDAFKTDAEQAREIKKLWSGTHEDKMKAIGLISGKDPLDEFVGIVKTYYNLEQESGDDPKDFNSHPAIKDLSGKLEAALKKIDALENGNKSKDEQDKKAATDAAIESANKNTKAFIEKHKAKFEICAREENAAEAIDLIQSAALVFLEKDGIDLKTLTPEQAEAAYLKAADKTEKEFEAIGKRMSKAAVTDAKDLSRFDRFVRKSAPPVVKVVDETERSKNPDEAFEQTKKRIQAKYEAGEYARH